jgi:sugar transferase EpsL
MIKRMIDLAISALAIVLLAPVIAVVALIVVSKMGRPVLFCQMRPGLHSKPFWMYKFRTMRDSVDTNGKVLADADRLTGTGKFLRGTSLDELPELWNVLRGDMSLVGPRPLLMQYLPLYTREQLRRHDVRPGITGMAQVNGRNSLTWDEKFALDVWYVDNHGIVLDLKILFRTIWAVFLRKDIASDGHATMPPFEGRSSDLG